MKKMSEYDVSSVPTRRRKKKIYVGLNPDLPSQIKHRLGVYEIKLANEDFFGAFQYFYSILELVVRDQKKQLTVDLEAYKEFKYFYNENRAAGHLKDGHVVPPLTKLRQIGTKEVEGDEYNDPYTAVVIPGFYLVSVEKINGVERRFKTWKKSLGIGDWMQVKNSCVDKLISISSGIQSDLMFQINAVSPGAATVEIEGEDEAELEEKEEDESTKEE